MQLKNLMTREVHTIAANASVQAAAEQMARLDIGALPVTAENRLVGMITDRDITVRAVAQGMNPAQAKVQETMSEHPEATFESAELDEAIQLMQSKQIRRLLVTSEQGELRGIVSLGDLAVRCHDKSKSGQALEGVVQARVQPEAAVT